MSIFVLAPTSGNAQKLKKQLQAVDEYIVQGEYDYAQELLVRILRKDEGVHQAHYKLALVYKQQDKDKKALEEAVKAVQLKPEEPNYNALLASVWFILEDEEKGMKYIDNALLIDSMLPEALLFRGDYYSRQGEFEAALADYKLLEQAVDNEPQTLYRIAYCHKQLFRFNKAAKYYNKSLQLNPLDVVGRYELAECYYVMQDYDDAVFELDQCEKLESNVPVLHLRAKCRIKQERLLEAKKDLLNAQAMIKYDLDLQLSLIQVEEMQREFKKALVRVDELIATYPDLKPILVLKGRIQAKLKRYNDAYRTFGLAVNGFVGSNTPFESQVLVYQNLLSHILSNGKEQNPQRCDSFAVYSYFFFGIKQNGDFICVNDPYLSISNNGVESSVYHKVIFFNALHKRYSNKESDYKKELERLIALKHYETIDYHLAEILLGVE
ncbi:MAG: tetratricopeptide repeat protein [Bacteroidia bacterium]